jgi:hypothetical protein
MSQSIDGAGARGDVDPIVETRIGDSSLRLLRDLNEATGGLDSSVA